jgi:hypothetical protein
MPQRAQKDEKKSKSLKKMWANISQSSGSKESQTALQLFGFLHFTWWN